MDRDSLLPLWNKSPGAVRAAVARASNTPEVIIYYRIRHTAQGASFEDVNTSK